MSSLFIIALTTLKRTEGAATSLKFTAELSDPITMGLTTIPAGRDIVVQGQLQSVGDGVLVMADVSTQRDYQCSRCLKLDSEDVEIAIQELFVYPERNQEYQGEDVSYISDDSINLEESIRDALILDQPLSPVCTPDCLGLCPTCGADLNAEPEHNHDDNIDTRWLTLSEWGKMS